MSVTFLEEAEDSLGVPMQGGDVCQGRPVLSSVHHRRPELVGQQVHDGGVAVLRGGVEGGAVCGVEEGVVLKYILMMSAHCTAIVVVMLQSGVINTVNTIVSSFISFVSVTQTRFVLLIGPRHFQYLCNYNELVSAIYSDYKFMIA